MKEPTRLNKVLSYQSFGFLAVITLCWLNSLLGLPSLIFEEQLAPSDFTTPVLQMLMILAVWLIVHTSTRRNLERLKHLEKFLHVCAWCHRVDAKGEWIPMEKFLERDCDTTTTHGICEDCLETHAESLGRKKQTQQLGGQELPAT